MDLVRRRDSDRFLTALFAPAGKRALLFTLYAFDCELARARAGVSVPMLALIRLQWWREVVDGADRRHEVATPLSEGIAAGAFDRAGLRAMIDAREAETDAIPTRAAFHAYLRGSAGGAAVAAARVLGAPEPEAFRPYGASHGLAGVVRGVPAAARGGRCLLPLDVLGAHGLAAEEVVERPEGAALTAVLRDLAADGSAWLRDAPPVPRAFLAAALPAVLARRDLRRPGLAPRPRGLGDKLAVTRAALLGRFG